MVQPNPLHFLDLVQQYADRAIALNDGQLCFDGFLLFFKVNQTNAGASEIDLNLNGVKDVVDKAGAALTGGELVDYCFFKRNSDSA